MGVDAKLTLSPGTGIYDVSRLIARLTNVGTRTIPSTVLGCDNIDTTGHWSIDPTGWQYRSILFQYEWWYDGTPPRAPGSPGFMMRSSAQNIALMVRIGEFFGGSIDFNDCDDRAVDVQWTYVRDPSETFEQRQTAIGLVKPITRGQAASYESVAAYKREGGW